MSGECLPTEAADEFWKVRRALKGLWTHPMRHGIRAESQSGHGNTVLFVDLFHGRNVTRALPSLLSLTCAACRDLAQICTRLDYSGN